MKFFKIFAVSIFFILASVYLTFLFVLPYTVDLNRYSPQIARVFQEYTGFQVDIKGLKVSTAWDLSAGAVIDKTDLMYPTGEKFAQINNLKVNLSLPHILFKDIKIDRINADKVLMNLKTDNKGEFLLEKYLGKNSPSTANQFRFSKHMPEVNVEKYRISILSGLNNYTFKGNNLQISDFILNKKIKIKTEGNVILNKRKQICYNGSIYSTVFPESKTKNADWIKVFDDIYRYNINAKILTNLKITEKNGDTNIDGKTDIDRVSFTFGGKVYPESNLKLDFRGDRAKINASLHADNSSKAIVTGLFKTGRSKFVNLQIVSDRVNLKDLLLISKAMSKPFGLKNLQNFNAEGTLKADFNLKSDFKHVESSGYLKVKNATITNKLYKVVLSGVNADIDFSQDMVKILQANANLNSQPITINGVVDKNAKANVSVQAKNLQLKGVLLAIGNVKVLRENDILQGKVDLDAILKGRLDKAVPKVNILVSSVKMQNKKSKTKISVAKAIIISEKDNNKAEITALKVYPNSMAVISAPKLTASFDKKNLNIPVSNLYFNNIKTNFSGQITNIDSDPKLNDVKVSIPNKISVPIVGYSGSSATLTGNLLINGTFDKPQMEGNFSIPSVKIPTMSTVLRNSTLMFKDDIRFNCPYMQAANSIIAINAVINKDFSKGIIVKNVNFNANNLNLNILAPILFNLQGKQGQSITILKGTSSVKHFRAADITADDITSNVSMSNNVLHLNNLFADAYFGKVAGNISYDIPRRKTSLYLQGRGLSANPALTALTQRNDDINGKLDFDTSISFVGSSKSSILSSLTGWTKFIISNGKMGVLGKFEHLLYAQNVVSNSVFKASLNLIAKAITAKNTGVYKYIKGRISFSNGIANIVSVKTAGPSMSLYITGRYYLADNIASLTMLGRISDDVVMILGPIGEFSMDRAISSIPKLGEITAYFANQFTTNPSYENTSQIPYLTPRTEFHTKEFKVVIDGDIQKQSSVKIFKWLSSPRIVQKNSNQEPETKKTVAPIPNFVKNLPDFKK